MRFSTLALAAFLSASPYAQAPASPAEALDGTDPVLLVQGKDVLGRAEFSVVHGKFKYLFSSADTKAAFERDPEKYAIQLDGSCARMGRGVGGNPADYYVHQGKIYIFGSDDCHRKFAAAPEKFLERPAPPMPRTPETARRGRELIDRAATAHGGASLDALTTYVETTTQTQKRGDTEATLTATTMWRYPDAIRVEQTTTQGDRTRTLARVATPQGGWVIVQGQVFATSPDGVDATARNFGRHVVPVLRRRSAPGVEVAALGRMTMGGVAVDAVRVRDRIVDVTLGLDPASGRVVASSFQDRNLDSEFGACTLKFFDFRTIGGLHVPFRTEALFNDQPDVLRTLTVTSADVNKPLAAELFQRPAGAK